MCLWDGMVMGLCGVVWCDDGESIAATGTGPVDAAYVAVAKALNIDNIKLLEFSVRRHSPAHRQADMAGRHGRQAGRPRAEVVVGWCLVVR